MHAEQLVRRTVIQFDETPQFILGQDHGAHCNKADAGEHPKRMTCSVAQISNLLYRRIAFGKARRPSKPPNSPRLADCKSAIQQIANLRYEAAPGHVSPRFPPSHVSRLPRYSLRFNV
jgi:hypothetical protein